jgi:DnaK suppressor protein
MNSNRMEYFRQKLLEKRASLEDVAQRAEEHGRENESSVMDLLDRAVASYTKEVMFGMSSLDHRTLQMIDDALDRIQNRSYGFCTNCDERIVPRRLDAVPWAPFCMECQSRLERNWMSRGKIPDSAEGDWLQ